MIEVEKENTLELIHRELDFPRQHDLNTVIPEPQSNDLYRSTPVTVHESLHK